jgi:putative NADH-flavin reductase
MRITVLGATGGLGRCVVEQALAAGYQVTACARRPGALDLSNPGLTFVAADVLNLEQVRAAVEGSDAVISTFGVKPGVSPGHLYSDGTRTLLAAMATARVRRLICVSTWLVLDSRRRAGPLIRVFVPLLQPDLYRDRERQEALVRASALDWTIVRPSRLTEGRRTGRYRSGTNLRLRATSHVSRADVAEFLLKQLAVDSDVHRAVTVSR